MSIQKKNRVKFSPEIYQKVRNRLMEKNNSKDAIDLELVNEIIVALGDFDFDDYVFSQIQAASKLIDRLKYDPNFNPESILYRASLFQQTRRSAEDAINLSHKKFSHNTNAHKAYIQYFENLANDGIRLFNKKPKPKPIKIEQLPKFILFWHPQTKRILNVNDILLWVEDMDPIKVKDFISEISFISPGFYYGWDGGENPFPEGVDIYVHLRDGAKGVHNRRNKWNWVHKISEKGIYDNPTEVISYIPLKISDDYYLDV